MLEPVSCGVALFVTKVSLPCMRPVFTRFVAKAGAALP